ncbi:hypothetical protein Pmani_020600 [Petrolisthes manimaculis]|uniref:Major facilitator superfamily (MFS) profile domain-containing protein n=1 Tax=Petrolisthes manimaculis TaxID=1843537 RepID=A0AAE1PGF7_9EUCA|nr:hypothetical protein Pmani_020600 [Petrolisthes manimaculis]
MKLFQYGGSYGGYCAVLGGVLIHLTLGNLYSFGNMLTYIASYMHQRVSNSVTYSNTVWVNSITTAAQGLFMVLGGFLERAVGPRITCFIGCSLMSGGIMLTYYTINKSLFGVVLSYGLVAGTGIALAYSIPLACGMKWFPESKGLVNGVIVAGFGLGALGSTTFQTQYLNPNNTPPDHNTGYFTSSVILNQVPSLFIALGCVFIVMQYIGIILINKPSVDEEKVNLLKEEGEEERELDEKVVRVDEQRVSVDEERNRKNLRPREILYEKCFYIFWFIYFFNTIAVGYINAMYKTYGLTFIHDDHFVSLVGSLAAIFNAGGRVCWGRLMDHTSFRIAMRLLCIILMLLFASLPITQHLGSKVGFALWLWFIFFTFSGTFVLMPTVVDKAFGARYYAANYGLIFTSQAVSGPLIALLNELMLDSLGYTGCFLTVASLIALNVMLTFLVPDDL